MKALVTGVAGFIGSHLAERLLDDGHEVVGIDAFTEYYRPSLKRLNLETLLQTPHFRLLEADLAQMNIARYIDESDVVFHLAGEPGVRSSWGSGFSTYLRRNILTTQQILEGARGRNLTKFVFASSSSVYGQVERLPVREEDRLRPVSPYGVSKLAAENLCFAYLHNYDVPTVALRFFTVYGPRQRPDMLISRVITSLREGTPVVLFGTGEQTRDFTYVADAVEATVRAAFSEVVGEAINVAGGARTSILQLITELGSLVQKPVVLQRQAAQAGDVQDTEAELTRARLLLNYEPKTELASGLREQVKWADRAAKLNPPAEDPADYGVSP